MCCWTHLAGTNEDQTLTQLRAAGMAVKQVSSTISSRYPLDFTFSSQARIASTKGALEAAKKKLSTLNHGARNYV